MNEFSERSVSPITAMLLAIFLAGSAAGADAFKPPKIRIPDGFELTVAAPPPLVKHPMMACFDDRGRLFVAETDGRNLEKGPLLKEKPRFIRMLEDTDGDGQFDKSTIFADKMVMPEGALWHQGALYVLSAPYLWRLEDTDNDGVADRREKLVGKFKVDGRPNQHGPYLGPCGRIYFSGGIFGYDLVGTDGSRTGKSSAGSVFSCRADGSDVKIEGQGPLNPVEVAFSAEGEMFSTAAIFDNFGGRHDALIHWIPGAVTRKQYGGPLLVKDTGHRLPALSRWGQVAPAGLARYRGEAFGKDYHNNLFACHFNTHKMVRVKIAEGGSTFRSQDSDFLTSESADFHPTDVIEDADGSLLVVDTGGWLYFGCPTSKIAKPNVRGAIYRISRKGVKRPADARGSKLQWKNATPAQLAGRLDDARHVVRDRAIATLVQQGDKAVPVLGNTLAKSKSVQQRRNIVWTLSRIGTKQAKVPLRTALADKASSVRHAAAHSAGVLKDAKAAKSLRKMLGDDSATLRRTAVTALGAIRDRLAVPLLLEVLARDDNDEFLVHAITHAMIEIGDFDSIQRGLAAKDPGVRRATLIALEQTDAGKKLTWEMVAPLLSSKNPDLRATVVEVIGKRKEWGDRVSGQVVKWLAATALTKDDATVAKAVLSTFVDDSGVQKEMAAALQRDATSATKQLVLSGIIASHLRTMPSGLVDAVGRALTYSDADVVHLAVAAVFAKDTDRLDGQLLALSRDAGRPTSLQLMALATAARHRAALTPKDLKYLLSLWRGKLLPVDRMRVAQALAGATLVDDDALTVADLLAEAGPLALPVLVSRFERESAPLVINVDVQPNGSRTQRGLAAFREDRRGDDAVWNIWNPLGGKGLEMLLASDGSHIGTSLSAVKGASLRPWRGSAFDRLMGDFVYSGKGGGKHQEHENSFTIQSLAKARQYDLYFYSSAHPKKEPRGARVTIAHRGGKVSASTRGLTIEDKAYRQGVTHTLHQKLRPRDDGTLAVSWTAGDEDKKGNYGVINGLTLVSPPDAFGQSQKLGLRIADAVSRSPGRGGLSAERLEALFSRFGNDVQKKVKPLIAEAVAKRQRRAARLEELLPRLVNGHVERGRAVFFGRKAGCAACHRAESRGGDIGPDLSRIGVIRTHRDLAESVLYPSVTIANGFENFAVVTQAGQIFSGVVHRETPTAIFLRQADAKEIRIERSQIDEMRRQDKSIMPDGFDRNLGAHQLADLIAYLKSLQ